MWITIEFYETFNSLGDPKTANVCEKYNIWIFKNIDEVINAVLFKNMEI